MCLLIKWTVTRSDVAKVTINGIKTTPDAPGNIEAYTYIPDMYFQYNKADLAWKWMKYITDVKDIPHERPTQGKNGDYPEISSTLVSQVIEGMMGIEPNAGEHRIITAPRLPSEVNDIEATNIPVGEHEVTIKHTGLTQTRISNNSSEPLTWEARFYGDYNTFTVDGQAYKTYQKDINGIEVSFAIFTVPANGTLEAVASNSSPEVEVKSASAYAGNEATVDIVLNYPKGIKTFEFQLNYDHSALELSNETIKKGDSLNDWQYEYQVDPSKGTVSVVAVSSTGFTTNESVNLMSMTFQVKGTPGIETYSFSNLNAYQEIDQAAPVTSKTGHFEILSSGGSIDPSPEYPVDKPEDKPNVTPSGDIILKPTIDTAGIVSAVISGKELSDAIKNNQDVVVNSDIGDIKLDQASLKQLEGKDVSIKLERAPDVKGKPAVTVTTLANGQPVTVFDGYLTIAIPYVKQSSELDSNLIVYRVDDSGNVIVPFATVIDGKIVFNTKNLATFAVGENSKSFMDVDTHWATDSIRFVTARELFQGVSADTFAPNVTMTRGMLVTVLGRLDSADVTGKTTEFADVDARQYYAPYIAWAHENAIILGTGNGEFAPDKAVTREEMATIILNYIKYTDISLSMINSANQFADEDLISSWARSAIMSLQELGIMNGKPSNMFDAKGTATRAEVSKVIHNLSEKALHYKK